VSLKCTLLALLAILPAAENHTTASAGPGRFTTGLELPEWKRPTAAPTTDWLLDGSSFKAGVFRGRETNELVLANGLVARTFRLTPNAATVGLDNLISGEAILRGVKPEAVVELDGTS